MEMVVLLFNGWGCMALMIIRISSGQRELTLRSHYVTFPGKIGINIYASQRGLWQTKDMLTPEGSSWNQWVWWVYLQEHVGSVTYRHTLIKCSWFSERPTLAWAITQESCIPGAPRPICKQLHWSCSSQLLFTAYLNLVSLETFWVS